MRIAVFVPWRGGDPYRERAWRYVATRWLDMGWPVVAGGARQEGPFNRAAARNEAARSIGWDVGVFADADCFVSGRQQIETAAETAALMGGLVLPFSDYTPLTKTESEALLAGSLGELPSRHPEPDPSVGGVIVAPWRLWNKLGGFDEGFVGWGFEDSAFYTMAGGATRLPGELWHLWHPPAPETDPNHPLHRANKAHAAELGYRS